MNKDELLDLELPTEISEIWEWFVQPKILHTMNSKDESQDVQIRISRNLPKEEDDRNGDYVITDTYILDNGNLCYIDEDKLEYEFVEYGKSLGYVIQQSDFQQDNRYLLISWGSERGWLD